MSESILKSVLEESARLEWEKYENVSEHRFSLKHKIAVKRIFSAANFAYNSSENGRTAQKLSLKRSLIIAAVLAFLAVFAGAVVVFRSENFGGIVHREYTKMFAVNTEGSPKTIEYKYDLAYVPEGFELYEKDSSSFDVYTVYMNKSTEQTIVLSQWVKDNFKPHYNTEHRPLEEVIVNGAAGLYIDFSRDTRNHSIIVWDNGDYIIEVDADLDKESTMNLCKINRVCEN